MGIGEFGSSLTARIGLRRKVRDRPLAGSGSCSQIATWSRAAAGWHESQTLKIARFGDNMREVAVTEGDKVEAQAGFRLFGERLRSGRSGRAVSNRSRTRETDKLCSPNTMSATSLQSPCVRRRKAAGAARTRPGSNWACARFLQDGGFGALTDTFQDLHGLKQLPGIAVQRLMAGWLRLRRGRRLEDRSPLYER